MQDYEARLALPLEGNPTQRFFTKSGTLVATGYSRIVIGGRGPYVEFELDQLVDDSLSISQKERWRMENSNVYYIELRSLDESNVKCYVQQKTVDYADYKVGKAYISPFDLYNADGKVLIEKSALSDRNT